MYDQELATVVETLREYDASLDVLLVTWHTALLSLEILVQFDASPDSKPS
jgi:hypothetical protein